MKKEISLKDVDSHFKFGENWSDFSELLTPERIAQAEISLKKIFGEKGLKGKSFLDIGSGSGLFSLAALNLGVKELVAVDIDPDSVCTTQATLKRFAPHANYTCKNLSVFNLDPKDIGLFDVVYSWGVLHHTGAMYEALDKARSLLKPTGCLLVALYKKTRFCEFWKKEKAFYTRAPRWIQKIILSFYCLLFIVSYLTRSKKNPFSYISNYSSMRGMSFLHDVHDWLGGYPYESISPDEMSTYAQSRKMKIKNSWLQPAGTGLLGSGCDEYLLTFLK
jgi:2-polyprenyl-3-methyl-5-hydroxy-6-metoxy-1,4-benzoquinol methylase